MQLKIFNFNSGDMSGNLRIRISDLWEKSARRKIFEVFFASSSQCVLLLPQKYLFIPRIALLFFRSALLLLKNVLFLFIVCIFLFIVCIFFKEWFFSSWLYLLLALLREIIFALLLFCFFLGLFTDQLTLYDTFLITLKPPYGVWFFMYFIQILASTTALKMQFLHI